MRPPIRPARPRGGGADQEGVRSWARALTAFLIRGWAAFLFVRARRVRRGRRDDQPGSPGRERPRCRARGEVERRVDGCGSSDGVSVRAPFDDCAGMSLPPSEGEWDRIAGGEKAPPLHKGAENAAARTNVDMPDGDFLASPCAVDTYTMCRDLGSSNYQNLAAIESAAR